MASLSPGLSSRSPLGTLSFRRIPDSQAHHEWSAHLSSLSVPVGDALVPPHPRFAGPSRMVWSFVLPVICPPLGLVNLGPIRLRAPPAPLQGAWLIAFADPGHRSHGLPHAPGCPLGPRWGRSGSAASPIRRPTTNGLVICPIPSEPVRPPNPCVPSEPVRPIRTHVSSEPVRPLRTRASSEPARPQRGPRGQPGAEQRDAPGSDPPHQRALKGRQSRTIHPAASIPHIPLIEFDRRPPQKDPELLLEGPYTVVLTLVAYVLAHILDR